MANPNPFHARLAKRKRAGDLSAAQAKLWRAIRKAEAVMASAGNPELTLRAIHALSQAVGQYTRVIETGELSARLEALEQAQQRRIA